MKSAFVTIFQWILKTDDMNERCCFQVNCIGMSSQEYILFSIIDVFLKSTDQSLRPLNEPFSAFRALRHSESWPRCIFKKTRYCPHKPATYSEPKLHRMSLHYGYFAEQMWRYVFLECELGSPVGSAGLCLAIQNVTSMHKSVQGMIWTESPQQIITDLQFNGFWGLSLRHADSQWNRAY